MLVNLENFMLKLHAFPTHSLVFRSSLLLSYNVFSTGFHAIFPYFKALYLLTTFFWVNFRPVCNDLEAFICIYLRNSLHFNVVLAHKFLQAKKGISFTRIHVYSCLYDFCSLVSHLKDSKSISDQFPKHKWIKMTKNEVKKWSPRLRPDIYLLSAGEKYLSSQKWEAGKRVSRV